jgi:hypothetical protein
MADMVYWEGEALDLDELEARRFSVHKPDQLNLILTRDPSRQQIQELQVRSRNGSNVPSDSPVDM